MADIAKVKNIHVASKITYTYLFSVTIKTTAVLGEKFITSGTVVTKQDVNAAADQVVTDSVLVVVASGCTGRLVSKRGRHAENPPVHVRYCQVLNIQSRGETLDTTEAEGEINASVTYHPDQCLGSRKQEGYLGSTEP